MSYKIVVIGAGIVGVSTALRLQRKGCKVTLIDPKPPGMETSFGNAGLIAQGYCSANAQPGIFKKVPQMLFEKTGPLSIQWSQLPTTLPWLMKFAFEALPKRAEANGKNLHSLSRLAVDGWQDLIAGTELDRFVRTTGWLHVFETQKMFIEHKKEVAFMRSQGIDIDVLSAELVADLEPDLARCFVGGSLQNDALSLSNPHAVVSGLADLFAAAGGQIIQDRITTVVTDPSGRICQSVKSNDRNYFADQYIITAGVWSKGLATQCGVSRTLPLIAERGYHIMLPSPEVGGFKRPVAFGERSFLLCPMTEGIRMTGQVELAKTDAKPNYVLHRHLLPLVKQFAPGIDVREQSIWMGNRPSLPDSLPVIGRSPALKNVILGFGHQHLGITLGPITARLIEQLVFNRPTEIALDPFLAQRF